ncbi:SMR family transporter, partial [Escherichia coli]|uniref:SMR family transporter n=1 Tax=Escherichia coli TaxID=562 RepID=UPI003EE20CD5
MAYSFLFKLERIVLQFGTTLMKFSEGFTRLWPSVGTIICYCASFWLLAQT